MTSFSAIVANKQLWYEFPHVIFGAFVTGSFIVAGLSAIMLFRKNHLNFSKINASRFNHRIIELWR